MFKPRKYPHCLAMADYACAVVRVWPKRLETPTSRPYLCLTSKNWVLIWDMKAGMERSRKLQEHILKQRRRTSYDTVVDVIDGQTVELTSPSTIRVGYFDNPAAKAEAARDSKFAPKLTLNLWWAVASWQAHDMRLITSHHRRPWTNWDMKYIYSSTAARPHRYPLYQVGGGFDVEAAMELGRRSMGGKPELFGLHIRKAILETADDKLPGSMAEFFDIEINRRKQYKDELLLHPDQESIRRLVQSAQVGALSSPPSALYQKGRTPGKSVPLPSQLDLPLFAHIALLKGLGKK